MIFARMASPLGARKIERDHFGPHKIHKGALDKFTGHVLPVKLVRLQKNLFVTFWVRKRKEKSKCLLLYWNWVRGICCLHLWIRFFVAIWMLGQVNMFECRRIEIKNLKWMNRT
jgi:hypothetical protein